MAPKWWPRRHEKSRRRKRRNTPCKACKTLLAAAKLVRAYNDAGKVPDFETPITIVSKPLKKWTIPASDLFNGCDAHQRFLHPYVWRPDGEKVMNIGLLFDRGRLQFYKNVYHEGDDSVWGHSGAELLLLNRKGARPGFALGRQLDAQFIDTKLISHWKKTCTEHHGSKCLETMTTLAHPLSFLIDTQQMCLVPATPDMAYVTLSYVWGQVRMLKTTQENVADLQKPNALEELGNQVPRTIRDAIGLVPLMEERYLWVDSLCIPQDDAHVVQLHVSQMAAIFEHASVTIVACDGHDAEFGLRGLRHSSQPRSLPGVLPLAPGLTLAARTEVQLNRTPWSRRGWTLQEQIFSRRSILFFENTVQWICRTSKYYEDVDAPHDIPPDALKIDGGERRAQLNPLDLSLDVPDLNVLCSLISNYSNRQLTYDEDAMSAFSSTFGAMRQAFPRGFVHGLPVSFLDATLIWRSRSCRMARRKSSREGVQCPPSWTWAGWRNNFHGLVWDSACYMKNPPQAMGTAHWKRFQVIPMLDWHTKREPGDSEEWQRIPFQNEWHDYKARYMGKEHNLPPGWVYKVGEEGEDALFTATRSKEDPECQITVDELPTFYFYEHESCPGRRFWHPVPIGNSSGRDSDGVDLPASPGQYLCAKTQKAQLWAAKPPWDAQVERAVACRGPEDFVLRMFGLDLQVWAVLRDDAGAIVGELCPDAETQLKHIWDAHPAAVPVEVVAISRGLHFQEPQPVQRETWSFYNVLWVEWEDGVAYRRGIGRVKRSVWEGLEKEDVSLVLG